MPLSSSLIGEKPTSVGGTQSIQVTPTSLTVVKAAPGRLCKVLLTTANGANAVNIYDNASTNSGTIIGYIPAAAAVGTLYEFQMPALLGITIAGTAASAQMTVSFN